MVGTKKTQHCKVDDSLSSRDDTLPFSSKLLRENKSVQQNSRSNVARSPISSNSEHNAESCPTSLFDVVWRYFRSEIEEALTETEAAEFLSDTEHEGEKGDT